MVCIFSTCTCKSRIELVKTRGGESLIDAGVLVMKTDWWNCHHSHQVNPVKVSCSAAMKDWL